MIPLLRVKKSHHTTLQLPPTSYRYNMSESLGPGDVHSNSNFRVNISNLWANSYTRWQTKKSQLSLDTSQERCIGLVVLMKAFTLGEAKQKYNFPTLLLPNGVSQRKLTSIRADVVMSLVYVFIQTMSSNDAGLKLPVRLSYQ